MCLKVYSSCCGNCLLSPDSIVSLARRKQIIKDCAKKQTHFFCHKSTMEGTEIVCKTYYDKLGHVSQLIRIAQKLNIVQFIEQPKADKLPTYNEMKYKPLKNK